MRGETKFACSVSCLLLLFNGCVCVSQPSLPIPNCLTGDLDLWFVEDTAWMPSISMHTRMTLKYRKFLELFLKDDPGPVELDRVHVGLASYTDNVTVHFNLSQPKTDLANLTEDLGRTLDTLSSGKSDTGNALRFILEDAFSPEMGSRPDAKHVVVLFVQDVPFGNVDLAREMTSRLTNQSDITVAIYYSFGRLDSALDLLPLDIAFSVSNTVWYTSSFTQSIRPLCRPCLPGWVPVTAGTGVSCYHVSSREKVELFSYRIAEKECANKTSPGVLPHIESTEELVNLERALIDVWLRYLPSDDFTVHLYINLVQFLWKTKNTYGWKNGRPLVYDKIGMFKPNIYDDEDDCFFWSITRYSHIEEDVSQYSNYESIFDIDSCRNLRKHLLCEESFRVTYDRPVIEPVIPSSDLWKQAKMSGQYFMVSQRESNDLYMDSESDKNLTISQRRQMKLMALSSALPFLRRSDLSIIVEAVATSKQTESREIMNGIPLFDCEEDYSREYVPYSRVCDRRSDCSTGKDEQICGSAGYRVCRENELSCTSGHCYPAEGKCDLYPDCQDGSDESDCTEECRNVECADYCILPSWVQDGVLDCISGSQDEPYHFWGTEYVSLGPCFATCNRSQCVTRDQILDNRTDCTGPEGSIDAYLGALEWTRCYDWLGEPYANIDEIWAPKCIYVEDELGAIIGCTSFYHLGFQMCENFTCPEGFYKCPKAYCIPLHYVKNQVPDCPYGEDENLPVVSENSNFQCLAEAEAPAILLHPSLVCDGHAHCPLADDETDCALTCPDGFVCGGGAVVATESNWNTIMTNLTLIGARTKYLDMAGVPVDGEFFMTAPEGQFAHVLWLNMSNCGVTSVDVPPIDIDVFDAETMKETKEQNEYASDNFMVVIVLDLSYNKLMSLENRIPSIRDFNIFGAMKNLHHLNLSHNVELSVTKNGLSQVADHLISLDLSFTAVSELDVDLMDMFTNLRVLSLQGTQIAAVSPGFPTSLHILDLRFIPLETVETETFKGLNEVQQILTTSYQLCCPHIRGESIPERSCYTQENVLSSCDDLIREPILRVLLWVFGSAALLGNVLVIVYRTTWDKALLKRGYGIFVLNLSLSDLLMGVYLVIIGVADLNYRGQYVLHEKSWRESWACQMAGFLSTWSSESSAIFIFLITLDRFLVIRFPFGQVRISPTGFVVSSIVAWVTGLCLALVPLLPPFQHWTVYSSNGMCLGLPLTTDRQSGWQFSTTVFVGVNFVLFLFIALGQLAIYRTMSSARISAEVGLSKFQELRRQHDITVAKQLSLVVISDFLCWFSIATMGLMTLAGTDLGIDAYAWTAVLVVPINSVINPVLYTVPAIKRILDNFVKRMFGKTSKSSSDTDKIGDSSGKSKAMSNYIMQLKSLSETFQSVKEVLLREDMANLLKEDQQSNLSLFGNEFDSLKTILLGKLLLLNQKGDSCGESALFQKRSESK